MPSPHRILLAVCCAAIAIAASAADMSKTLRVAFSSAETGLDPQASYDVFSSDICRSIFDPLYTYDYFARPVKLIPNTAEALPVVTDGGRTYTIKIKRGIYFAADPAFKGKPRELTAEDYVYSIKRIIDPKVRSYWLYLLEKQPGGSRSGARQGARDRHARLRDEHRRAAGARPLHAAHPLQPSRLRVPVVAHERQFRRGRPRDRRRVQGREQPRDGQSRRHGPVSF